MCNMDFTPRNHADKTGRYATVFGNKQINKADELCLETIVILAKVKQSEIVFHLK